MSPITLKLIAGISLSSGTIGTGLLAYKSFRTMSIEEYFQKHKITPLKADSSQDSEWKKILGNGSESETSSDTSLKDFVKRNKESDKKTPAEDSQVNLSELKNACTEAMKKESVSPNLEDTQKYCVKRPEKTD